MNRTYIFFKWLVFIQLLLACALGMAETATTKKPESKKTASKKTDKAGKPAADNQASNDAQKYPGVGAPPDAKKDLTAFRAWLKRHPSKIFIVSPVDKKHASIFAEKSVTLTPKLGVMGIDFRNGPPKQVWIYSKKLIAAKCTYVFLKDDVIRRIAMNLALEGKTPKDKKALERLYRRIHIKMECVAKEPISQGVVKSLILPSSTDFPAIVTKRGAFSSGFFSSIYRTGMLIYVMQL